MTTTQPQVSERNILIEECALKFLRAFLPYEAKGEYFTWEKFTSNSLLQMLSNELEYNGQSPISEEDKPFLNEVIQYFFEKSLVMKRNKTEYNKLFEEWAVTPIPNMSIHAFLELSLSQYEELMETNETTAQRVKIT